MVVKFNTNQVKIIGNIEFPFRISKNLKAVGYITDFKEIINLYNESVIIGYCRQDYSTIYDVNNGFNGVVMSLQITIIPIKKLLHQFRSLPAFNYKLNSYFFIKLERMDENDPLRQSIITNQ